MQGTFSIGHVAVRRLRATTPKTEIGSRRVRAGGGSFRAGNHPLGGATVHAVWKVNPVVLRSVVIAMGSDARHFCWDFSADQIRLSDSDDVESKELFSGVAIRSEGYANGDGGALCRTERRVFSGAGAASAGGGPESETCNGRELLCDVRAGGCSSGGLTLGCESLTPPGEGLQLPAERALHTSQTASLTPTATRLGGQGSGGLAPTALSHEEWSRVYARFLQAMQRTRELEVQLSLAKSEMLRLQGEYVKASWARRHANRSEVRTTALGNRSETGMSWDVVAPEPRHPAARSTTVPSTSTARDFAADAPAEVHVSGGGLLTRREEPALVLGQAPFATSTHFHPSQSISSYASDFRELASVMRKNESHEGCEITCDCSTASSGTDDDRDCSSEPKRRPEKQSLVTAPLGMKTSSSLVSELAAETKSGRSKRRRRTPPVPGTTRYWTESEHKLFLEALKTYGHRNLKAISAYVGTRNATQVRTHIQKYFMRLAREAQRLEEGRKPTVQQSAKTRPQPLASNGDADSMQSSSSKRATEHNPSNTSGHHEGSDAPPSDAVLASLAPHADDKLEAQTSELAPERAGDRSGHPGTLSHSDETERPREGRKRPFNTVPDTCGVHLLSLVAQENML